MKKPATKKDKTQRSVLDDCIKQIDTSNSYWGDNKKKFRYNLDFVLGYQWESQGSAWQGRRRNTRLTFNMLYPYIKSIMGEQLQNTPDTVVRAASRNVEQWEVNLNEGILRGIHYDSDLPQKTYKVFFNQLAGGYGAYFVHPEYESGMSFNQVMKIDQKEDPTLCYWDADAKDDNKIRGDFCGFFTPVPKKEFEDEYPDIVAPSGFAWEIMGVSRSFYSQPFDYIVIAEHWKKEYRQATIYQLDDGSTCTKEEYQPLIDKLEGEYAQQVYLAAMRNEPVPPIPELPQIVNEKRDRVYKIKYYKLLRNQIIEEKEWPGTLLPLVYVDGDSMMRRGRQEIKSFCDFAHDSQRAYNYTKNQIMQQIKNFRREQWIGTPDNMQGKGVQEMWRNPEEQAGILLAKRDEKGELPQKIPPSQISPDLLNMQQFLTSDIQNILGRHEASQGQQGNETSGVALLHRIVQDNMGSYLQLNNLCKAIVAIDEICLDMIPAIYDSERDVMTRDKKGLPMVATINEFAGMKTQDDGTYAPEQSYYKNQISRKSMRVELSAGPMFSAQKQIEFNKLIQISGLMPPETVPALIDMIAENIDLPNTNQVVKRLRTMVPKQMLMQSGELSEEEQAEMEQQMQQQAQQQAQQGPPPEIQIQMQRNQLDQEKLAQAREKMDRDTENDEMVNYLKGLQIQVDLEQIQSNRDSDSIALQKDIIKANAQLESAAMNALHKLNPPPARASAT